MADQPQATLDPVLQPGGGSAGAVAIHPGRDSELTDPLQQVIERAGVFQQALRLFEQDDLDAAAEALCRVIGFGGDYADAATPYLGLTHLRRQDYQAAADVFQTAIEDFTGCEDQTALHELRSNYALCLIRLDRIEEAIRQNALILSDHPRHATALYNNARAYALKGDAAACRQQLRQAIRADGECWEMAQSEKDFDVVRQSAEFAELMRSPVREGGVFRLIQRLIGY